MEKAILNWIECDGGPHILLEKHLVEKWEAVNCSSHYDKACEIDDYIGLLPVGDGYGIVISEDVPRSTWIEANDKKGGYLVVLNYVEENIDENTIIQNIKGIDENLFEPSGLQVSIKDHSLFLFAACDYGPDWIYSYSDISIEPGKYAIDSVERYTFGDCSFRVHRLKPI